MEFAHTHTTRLALPSASREIDRAAGGGGSRGSAMSGLGKLHSGIKKSTPPTPLSLLILLRRSAFSQCQGGEIGRGGEQGTGRGQGGLPAFPEYGLQGPRDQGPGAAMRSSPGHRGIKP